MYHIGDKIVYPTHGAGIIEAIEEKEVLGKRESYYIMRIPSSDMTVMIPMQACDSIGVRCVMKKEEAAKVLEAFKNAPLPEDLNWNRRHRENLQKIKSGDIYKVMQVVKDLMYRDRSKGLSTSERKMLNNSRQILVSELVLSSLANQEEIESIMADTVDGLV
ncbi:MAG: CarD family transcriptional regulator [Oscillospiraceae bacterium]|nr:CarD family transcriptional regulator [Oscillospiraceae bacterium]